MPQVLLSVFVFCSYVCTAHVFSQPGITGYVPMGIGGANHLVTQAIPEKKWFTTSSVGISAGFYGGRGGQGSFVAVPLSVQLNRRINNNLYAFAGLGIAPGYSNFNDSFLSVHPNSSPFQSGFYQGYQPGLYTNATMGLFYINDSKTFSISGSFSVSRSNYQAPMYYHPKGNQTQYTRQ